MAAMDVAGRFWIVGYSEKPTPPLPANTWSIGDYLPEGWKILPHDLLLGIVKAAEAITTAGPREES